MLLVLLLEILKPFFMIHFNILMHSCIFLSMVTMFFRTVTNEEVVDI